MRVRRILPDWNKRMTAGVLVAALLLGFGVGASPAGAITTSYVYSQLKALGTKVASLGTSITGVKARVAALESKDANKTTFWPETMTFSIAPVVEARYNDGGVNYTDADGVEHFYPGVYERTITAGVSALVDTATLHDAACPDWHGVIDVTCGAYHVRKLVSPSDYGVNLDFAPWDNLPLPTAAPAAGTPVNIEYWIEAYGQQLHGEATTTEWRYELP